MIIVMMMVMRMRIIRAVILPWIAMLVTKKTDKDEDDIYMDT